MAPRTAPRSIDPALLASLTPSKMAERNPANGLRLSTQGTIQGESPTGDDLGRHLRAQFLEAATFSQGSREGGRECVDFYDGEQWSPAVKQQLINDGRPPIVINQIFKAINNVLGREADSRFSFKLSPLVSNTVGIAEQMTRAVSHLSQLLELDMTISDCVEAAAKGPMAWATVHWNDSDPTREATQVEFWHPDNVFMDSFSRKRDLSDCRFIVLLKAADLDETLANFPDVADELVAHCSVADPWDSEEGSYKPMGDDYGNRSGPIYAPGREGLGWFDPSRKRLVLREHWWYEMEVADVLELPDGRTFDWEPNSPLIQRLLRVKGAKRRIGKTKCFYYAIVAGTLVLHKARCEYKDREYPIVPLWCYRTRKGEPYGMIANMRWPQIELNTARSRFNEAIRSINMLVKKGALSPEEIATIRANMTKANWILEVSNPDAIKFGDNKADGTFWANLMETSRREIDDVVGQNEASYGDKSNEKSGIAITKRVQQQAQNMGRFWDNIRWFRMQIGKRLLSRVLQYWDVEKLRRCLEMGAINSSSPIDTSWLDEYDNDTNPLEALSFLVALENQAETTTERQAQMQQATDLLQYVPPQAAAVLVPDILRMSDFPGAVEWAARVEQAMQGPPPAAPPPPPPPRKQITDLIKWAPADFSPSERAQILAMMEVQADPQGPPQSASMIQAQTSRMQVQAQIQQAAAPAKLDPNKAMAVNAKLAEKQAQMNHDTQQLAAQHQHETVQNALNRYHQAHMALFQQAAQGTHDAHRHTHTLAQNRQQHGHALVQDTLSALLAPKPSPQARSTPGGKQ